MNLEKLVKQFRRDMVANPKKAAALGLMVLVALYFWGPLVGKWMKSGKRSGKGNLASLILTDDPAEPSDQSKGRTGGKFRWEKVRQAIHQDPRMVTATFDPGWIDPFGYSPTSKEVEITSTVEPADATQVSASDLAPADVGLVLTSVLISPRNRMATISGETYRVGDLVSAKGKVNSDDKGKNSTLEGIEFRVVQIRPNSVELKRGDETFVLELLPALPGRAARIEATNRKPK